MTAVSPMAAPDNFAHACCGRWAADRARFALYCADAGGAESAWTFRDIQREASRFSNVLAAMGVMRGDRVALLLPQRAETAALHIACYQMGAVAAPLSPALGMEELGQALAASGSRVAVVGTAGAAALAAMPADSRPRHAIGIGGARGEGLRDWNALRPLASPRYTALDALGDAPALLVDAGGAQPREFTHAALVFEAERFAHRHAGYPQPGDLFWSPLDWTGAGLLEGLLAVWQHGQPLVAYDGGFEAAAAMALIDRYEVRNARLTPQQLEAMMKSVPRPNDKHDCQLRTLATGGAPLDAALAAWVRNELGVVETTPA